MNTPVKYTMNMWKALPGYPTKPDVLYEILVYLVKSSKTEFSLDTLNSVWDVWRGTVTEDIVNEFIDNGTFVEVKEKSGKARYKISNNSNPFI